MRTYPMSLVSTLEHLTILRMDALAIYSYSSGPKVSLASLGLAPNSLLPGANLNEARTHLGPDK